MSFYFDVTGHNYVIPYFTGVLRNFDQNEIQNDKLDFNIDNTAMNISPIKIQENKRNTDPWFKINELIKSYISHNLTGRAFNLTEWF